MAIRHETLGQFPNHRRILIADTEAELLAEIPGTEIAEGYAKDTGINADWVQGVGWKVGGATRLADRSTSFDGPVSAPNMPTLLPDGTIAMSGPVSAPNITPTDARNRVALFGNSIGVDSYFPTWKLNTHGPWQPYAGIALDGVMHPIHLDLRGGVIPLSYKCTTAGQTGAQEPNWPTVAGQTIQDGDCVWTAIEDFGAFYWRLGAWTLAQAMSGQKFDEVYMVGASGQNSPAILSYREASLAANPNVMAYLHLWGNDIIENGMTLAAIQARFAAFESAVMSDLTNGRLVILGTELPRALIDSTSAFTGYSAGLQTQMWHWINANIRRLGRLKNVYLADWAESYIDPNWATPVYPDNVTTFVIGSGATQKYTLDGSRPYLAGHFAMARILAATLRRMPGEVFGFSPNGAYQNLSLNPLNYGSGGTGTNVAGTISDKKAWNATVAGATASVVARTDGVNGFWQRIVGSFAATSKLYGFAGENLTVPVEMRSMPLQGYMEIKVAANPTKLQEIIIGLGAPGKSMASLSGSTPEVSQMLGQFIKEDTTFLFKTPPVKLPPTATLATLYPMINTTGAGAAYDISIGRGEIRRAAA